MIDSGLQKVELGKENLNAVKKKEMGNQVEKRLK